jgi:hypothetical protein
MSDTPERTPGFIDNLGDAARRNPLSAALIGMGVLWLFAGGKSAGRAGDLLRSTGLESIPEATKNTFSSVKSGIADSTGGIREAAGSSFDAVRERSADAVNQTAEFAQTMPNPGDVFETARDNLTELFRAQPLALGAIGLAIGAGIAAALPSTEVENAYLGEASETVRSKTAEIAGQQVDKAATIAMHLVDAGAEEARNQGLTAEGARAMAGDLANRVGRVVDAARTGAAERAD